MKCILILAGCFGFMLQAATAQSAGGVVLKEGTEVKLRFTRDLSSKTARLEDPVDLTLEDDIKLLDIIVVRTGAKATGVVSAAKRSGMMGKGGELSIRLETLRAGDNKIRLRGNRNREGDSKVGTAVALTVLLGPLGLMKHGKNIEISSGSLIIAYVAEDIALPPAR